MIAVVDYGIGNVSSIMNMIKKIGASCIIANNIDQIQRADKLILPGVGAFDVGIQRLNKSGFTDIIKKFALEDHKPILGICLGMQMLGRKSEEGNEDGLGLIPFDNIRFSFDTSNKLKIPHMGWDMITTCNNEDRITQGLSQNQRYYFVHSYHAVCDNIDNVLMRCDYGYSFAAAVKKDNIYGVQFHPEKSHKFGMSLLENFARRV